METLKKILKTKTYDSKDENKVKTPKQVREAQIEHAFIKPKKIAVHGSENTKKKPPKKTSAIQAVLFKKDRWTAESARKWLEKHKIVPIKDPRQTKNEIRFRVKDPTLFKRFRTIKEKDGIDLVVAFK